MTPAMLAALTASFGGETVPCSRCGGRPTVPPCSACFGRGYLSPGVDLLIRHAATHPTEVWLCVVRPVDFPDGGRKMLLRVSDDPVPFPDGVEAGLQALCADGLRPEHAVAFARAVSRPELAALLATGAGLADHPAACGLVEFRWDGDR